MITQMKTKKGLVRVNIRHNQDGTISVFDLYGNFRASYTRKQWAVAVVHYHVVNATQEFRIQRVMA